MDVEMTDASDAFETDEEKVKTIFLQFSTSLLI